MHSHFRAQKYYIVLSLSNLIPMSLLSIDTPKDFNFKECLRFLRRSELECLFEVENETIIQALEINNKIFLIKVYFKNQKIKIQVDSEKPNRSEAQEIKAYVKDWLDIEKDLTAFYAFAKKEKLLRNPVKNAKGLRLIGIPNFTEAICWAVIGQQINLTFAYSLKKRLVENFGKTIIFKKKKYFLFPKAEVLAELTEEDLRPFQFSRSKAKYLIGVGQHISEGKINKNILQQLNYEEAKTKLIELKGIGPWSADYVLMKCFRHSTAFPIADIGIHHAIRNQMGWDRKPTIPEIENMIEHWSPQWMGYATFYMWHSLLK